MFVTGWMDREGEEGEFRVLEPLTRLEKKKNKGNDVGFHRTLCVCIITQWMSGEFLHYVFFFRVTTGCTPSC